MSHKKHTWHSAIHEAYKVIGADVTGEAILSAFDIVKSRQMILSQILAFDVPAWKFGEKETHDSVIIGSPANPTIGPHSMTYQPGTHVYPGLDFIAIKMGDVNLTYTSN